MHIWLENRLKKGHIFFCYVFKVHLPVCYTTGVMWCLEHEDDQVEEEDITMAMNLISSNSVQKSASSSPSCSTSPSSEEEIAMDEERPVTLGGSVVQQITLEEVMKKLLSYRKTDW